MGNPIPRSEFSNEQSSNHADTRVRKILFSEDSVIQRAEKAESELSLLRSDYLSRMAGMVKAIAAVERSRERAAESIGYLESLNEMCAGELIEEYRRVSARFRSAFPTSFGLGPVYSRKSKSLKNVGDFK